MVTNDGRLVLRIDGGLPPTAAAVAALTAACSNAEDGDGAPLMIEVSGVPREPWAGRFSVAQVSKWERAVRRLERLRVTSVAVATGDCGGPALDVLLATDYRIASTSLRMVIPVESGATWPGMALYRLASQAGGAAVRRLALFGEPLTAAEALALRLVDEVTDDPASALAAAAALTDVIAGPELAVRRQLMLDAVTVSFEDALGAHLAACDRALRRLPAVTLP